MQRSFLAALYGFVALIASGIAKAERINHEGRILGPEPVVTTPTLFNTPQADAIVSAMQIMPVDNPWNEDISRRPLLANSAAMIARIKADLSASRQTLRPFYEMNYVLVPNDQPRVPIRFFNYADESDLDGGSGETALYPIPPNMPVEGWPRGTGNLTLEQWQEDVNNTGGDRHSIIVMPGAQSIWETWLTRRVGANWEASNGAKFRLDSNALRPAGWTSADAAGLPMFPAVVRYEECERGMVEHALRLIVARTRREYIYPATHYASSIPATSVDVPAMGQRLRLRADFVIPENWSKYEKAVLRAFKKYGGIVADNGGFFSISVSPDDRFPANAFANLSSIDISNFEVIQTTGPNDGPRSPGAPTVNAGADQMVEFPASVTLQGSASVPQDRATTVRWRLYSGPGEVTFGDASNPSTTVSFSAPGTYTLMLSADDGVHAVAYDAVVISVTRRNSLANISTRVGVQSGEKVAVAGFIINGSATKRVILRAIGPSMTSIDSAVLADPILELYDSAGSLLFANDDWKDSQEQAVRDSTIPPSHDRESAIVVPLPPGSYTAVVRGKNNAGGIGLVEVYDLERSAASKLANISTRGAVGTDGAAMIGGLILSEGDPGRLLLRAIGPSLAAAGIQDALRDPQIELFDRDGAKIAENNNWKHSQRAQIESTGAAPASDAEAALLIELNPGAYTAVVRGLNGSAGVALVEAYNLP